MWAESVVEATGGVQEHRYRLLHVDDDPFISELVRDYLEIKGDELEVESVNSVVEALTLLESEQYDCVVSDYEMAEVDGLEFLSRVRAQYPSLPFILFTGQGTEGVASKAISKGVTEYVQKGGPEQLVLLKTRVEHALEQSRLQQKHQKEIRKFRAVFEQASDAMVLADEEGRYVDANPAACGLFGVEKPDLLGMTVGDFAPPESGFSTAFRQFKESDTKRGRFPLVRPNGEQCEVEYAISRNITPGVNLSILRPVSEGNKRSGE
jgi:PAS domain S-box-containing protein